jgi:hypothetical protein
MAATKTNSKIEALCANLDQAATISGVSRWTWRSMAYSGQVESLKIGRRLLIPLAEISRVMTEGRRPRRDGLPAGAPSAKQPRRPEAA